MSPLRAWNTPLQRAFSGFPSGSIGVALFVLRAVVGMTALAEGSLTLAQSDSLLSTVLAFAGALAGLALVLGFVTVLASSLLAFQAALLFPFSGAISLHLLDSHMALLEFMVMAAVLAVLGPGATSIDARLFGRREVAISDQQRPNDP